jgi:hypothetical protein
MRIGVDHIRKAST